MIKECAAKIGARRCQHPREDGKMFCSHHLTSGQRFELPYRIHVSPDVLLQVPEEVIRRELLSYR